MNLCKKFCYCLAIALCAAAAPEILAQQRGGGGGFGGGNAASSGASTRDYGNNTSIGDATVTVDADGRKLIVVTDDGTYANISNVIANLDRPKPQVLIKVVFVEVTHSDALDIGLEASYFHNPSPSNLNGLGLTNGFNLAQLGTTGQQIGSTVMPAGAGIYSVLGKDFQATLRAISSAGKLEVLSRPSVMVRNNQPATIKVGQSVPLVTGVQFVGVNSVPVNIISYRDIGIILQVTPFITDNGLVEMIVAPEISSLSERTVNIAAGVNVPVINLRSASTVVVTPDRETVIIGGLMENDQTTINSKIPLLGDIPGLGALFRHKQKANLKTELLIFLTPTVVQAATEIASLSNAESANAKLAGPAFGEDQLNQYLGTQTFKKAPEPVKPKTGKGGASSLGGQ